MVYESNAQYLCGCGRGGGGSVDSFILSTLKVGKLSALRYHGERRSLNMYISIEHALNATEDDSTKRNVAHIYTRYPYITHPV